MSEKNKILKHIDYGIILSVFALFIMGLITISSATHAFSEGGSIRTVMVQAIFGAIGLIAAIVIIAIDYNTIGGYYKIFYILGILGLIGVLIFGVERNGAKAWLGIGSFGIQPAEVFKIIMIVVMAKVLEDMENINTLKNLGKIAIVAIVPMALIQLQPDAGTNLIYAVIIFGMIFYAGLDKKIIWSGAGIATLALLAVWFLDILKPYQKFRIKVFLDPTLDMTGEGYNAYMALTAAGSGKFFGSGLFEGTMAEGNFIPEQQTDFIFSIFAEEWGFLGCVVLLALYFNIIWRGIKIARESKDKFGSYMVVGVVTMLTFQIFQNIGMDIGLMPITGIPLPFMSYGGSSLITTIMSMAILINVSSRKQKINF